MFLVHTKAIPTTVHSYAFVDYNGEGIMWSMRNLLWLTLCITVLQHYNVAAIYPRMPHLSHAQLAIMTYRLSTPPKTQDNL